MLNPCCVFRCSSPPRSSMHDLFSASQVVFKCVLLDRPLCSTGTITNLSFRSFFLQFPWSVFEWSGPRTLPALYRSRASACQNRTLGCSMLLPVAGPCFRGRFGAGLGRKPNANGPQTGPKLPGGQLGTVFGPCAVGLRPKPAHNRPRK